MSSSTPSTPAPAPKLPGSLSVPLWQHFAAGTIGGGFGITLAYPLDTVKVRMQTRPAGTYKGIVDCLGQLIRNEGVMSMYRGLLSPVVGYGLINATVFGSNSVFRGWVRNHWHNNPYATLTLWELALCGAGAGFTQSFVRAPIEQLKIVMQARNKPGSTAAPYKSTVHCLIDVVRTEGIRVGLYRSLTATIGREIPQYALYYPVYETFRGLFTKPGQHPDTLSPIYVVISGGMAGVFQWLPTYSFDVVKSRVAAAQPGEYSGMIDCARKLYRMDGLPVFFRGLSAALVRAFPLHGAIFFGYETTLKMLRE